MTIITVCTTCSRVSDKGLDSMKSKKKKDHKCGIKRPSPQYYIAVIIEQLITVICLNIMVAYIAEYAVFTVEKHDIKYLYYSILLALVCTLVALLVLPFMQYISVKHVKNLITDLKKTCYRHTVLLERGAYGSYHEGEIMSHFSDDIREIEEMYVTKIRNLISVIIAGPISIAALISLNRYIALCVILFGIITLIVAGICARRSRFCSVRLQDAKSGSGNVLLDILNSLEDIKLLNISETMNGFFEKACGRLYKATKKAGTVESFMSAFSAFMYYFKQIVVLALGIYLISKGKLSVGELVGSIYLLVSASYVFDNFGNFYTAVQKSLVCRDRIIGYLGLEEEKLEDTKEKLSDKESQAAPLYEFKNVSFGYDSDEMILKNISTSIYPGEYTAIVGPSGSGKSTIIRLLLRFYNESSGEISLGGKKLRDYTLMQVRNQCAFVPQEPYLFPGTVRENILYGNLDATEEELIDCSQKALCHDFIMQMSDGYDTELSGETGLSGGQKQRIAIARALIKKTPVLLLDEPTAALDAESEKMIIDTLKALKKEITIIVITHKLYTISDCDKVIIIRDGEISEQGNYQTVKKSEEYRHLLV